MNDSIKFEEEKNGTQCREFNIEKVAGESVDSLTDRELYQNKNEEFECVNFPQEAAQATKLTKVKRHFVEGKKKGNG